MLRDVIDHNEAITTADFVIRKSHISKVAKWIQRDINNGTEVSEESISDILEITLGRLGNPKSTSTSNAHSVKVAPNTIAPFTNPSIEPSSGGNHQKIES
jgi:hypothetical protein